ncbi:3-phosphoshikimate 1-carboxyvinyltransferase [Chitinophaga polysaccharea]|uniref:3-phosphoshikimate 1-carboxyvinyltransferase n=1 Tax=Chitinophaga TaxID=79328 RepID=UPI001454F51B|nr:MULTISPECIES: 3-phosphoshikimate 1-carboxyvinyltransferase [Chitinophaga]NLR61249.1 3-phosphoshikimate 1-carboxyvinyltransferase [Chitinophaga polysaccharea]NLU95085.1 3-phosphoshikimate 1-carboxyvinyltransferase [Chitinophaga sp. Ak27]
MQVTVSPAIIKGTVTANPSKSAMQRAVAAALLAKGTSIIRNPGLSNDCLAALEVAENLGAKIKREHDYFEITSNGVQPFYDEINCGESGLGIRMFTPIAALSSLAITIEGHGSLTTRPMNFFEEVLPQLDVKCSTREGKLPLHIQGPLQPKDITIDGSLSSQFLTGLLMAYGAAAENATITVKDLKSKPYIALTLQLMAHFGVQVEEKNFETFHFGKKQAYKPCDYTVEGDWSGAAFLLVAAAVAGKAEVQHLNVASAQSDKAILEALEKAGAHIMSGVFTVNIEKGGLRAFEIDATDCPDLFPPLVALAANCNGTTKIKGVSRLAHKESDRGITLQEEFGKMGIQIDLQGDIMLVHGGTGIKGATVHSHNDHRIAMACAVAALTADGPVVIENAEAINKSYPEFYDHLALLGGKVAILA